MKKPFIATFSKLDMEKQCPRKFYLMEGSKCLFGKPIIPFQISKAMEDGKIKHQLLEDYAKVGSLGTDPDGFWRPWWGELIDSCKKRYPEFVTEKKIGISPDWSAHPLGNYYRPKYGNPEIKFQGAIDCTFFSMEGCASRAGSEYAVVFDWKSGKFRKPSGIGQLAMYALFLFCTYSQLKKIDCYFVFLDHRQKHKETFHRTELDTLKQSFSKRFDKVNKLLKEAETSRTSEDMFKCNKTPLCGWCPATKEYCEYGS
jgi:hypothetical protein